MKVWQDVQGKLSEIGKVPLLSAVSPESGKVPNAEALAGFRRAQDLAFACAVEVGRDLQPGWTERRAAELMDQFLRDCGVRSFFHHSFAWFGERTKFSGMKHYWDFLPTDRRLGAEDVIILDTAPIVDGYAGDIGFTFSLSPNQELTRAREFLRAQREAIRLHFESALTTGDIWRAVDRDLRASRYENCHARYPFGVLGHRLHKTPLHRFGGVIRPFGLHSFWNLLSRGLLPELLGEFHRGEKTGIWAIEPHLGAEGFGAKFEEILVVEPERVYWLADDVPHVLLPEGFLE